MRLLSRIVAVVTFVLVPALASAQETPAIPSLSADQIAEMRDGEVMVSTQRGDPNRGEAIGIVCAPIDELWEIVLDFDNMHRWFPDMLVSDIVSRDGEGAVGYGETNMPWPVANRTWQARTVPGQRTIGGVEAYVAVYEYVDGSGNMDEMYGYWLLTPADDGCTLVRYVVNADLGIWLPDVIINWASRRLLPGTVEGLGERWEALH